MANPNPTDPIVHNALRYTFNTTEYAILHTNAPAILKKRAISPQKYRYLTQDKDDFHPAAVRAALRVFMATSSGLKLWDVVQERLLSRGKLKQYVLCSEIFQRHTLICHRSRLKTSILKSPNLRLALSLSTILYLHRILYRFFFRLRLRLLSEKAKSLRVRYPNLSRLLTSRLIPAFGASLAGLALGIQPSGQLRLTITIYVAARSLEFLYNALDREGWFSKQPKWIGAWLFFPISCGQLLHAFVFDRDCFPKACYSFSSVSRVYI